MRVPPINTFGRFGVPKYIKGKANIDTRSDNDFIKPIRNDTVSFSSTAKYLKKYLTLPDEIKKVLSPTDAIDMFQSMDWIAQGKIKEEKLGEGETSSLYSNPWLNNYYLLILKYNDDDEILIYSGDNICNTVWKDSDNCRIQLLRKPD